MDYEQRVRHSAKRKDLLVECEPALVSAFEAQINAQPRDASKLDGHDTRRRVRRTLLEPIASDPYGYERLIGDSDFVSVNFLARGIEAANAVCRLRVPSADGGWYGSGFLVGPGLLMTNHHVLASAKEAAQAEAEFGYEHDVEGVLKEPVQFNLDPSEIFFTDKALDITLIAVAEFSDGGVPLERFGFLPLLPISGKGLDNEWVTIAQHPGGQPKQMTVRASRIVELDPKQAPGVDTERFIHYVSDTEPGSSGAPVLNDQWQVIAIHHKAIPKPGQDIERLIEAGESPQWLANEGTRISAINQLLESLRFSDHDAAKAVRALEAGIGLPSSIVGSGARSLNDDGTLERDPRPHAATKWTGWSNSHALGFDADFLPLHIDPMEVLGDRARFAAPLNDGSGVVLNYLHFSCVVEQRRKFPMLTASNIHGDALRIPGGQNLKFREDIRMASEYQPAGNFYERNRGTDPVQFSRGHMVRRLDPCWGTAAEAKTAELHTYHYTNAAPQVQGFNAGDWLDIEDYVLNQAQVKDRKMSVFTGPVFRRFDPKYGASRDGGPWRIPVTYWKVIVVEKDNGEIAATAFLQGQTKFIEALLETRVFRSLRRTPLAELQSSHLQTTIRQVERQSKLNFSMLREHDVANALEGTRQTRALRSLEDIQLW